MHSWMEIVYMPVILIEQIFRQNEKKKRSTLSMIGSSNMESTTNFSHFNVFADVVLLTFYLDMMVFQKSSIEKQQY